MCESVRILEKKRGEMCCTDTEHWKAVMTKSSTGVTDTWQAGTTDRLSRQRAEFSRQGHSAADPRRSVYDLAWEWAGHHQHKSQQTEDLSVKHTCHTVLGILLSHEGRKTKQSSERERSRASGVSHAGTLYTEGQTRCED